MIPGNSTYRLLHIHEHGYFRKYVVLIPGYIMGTVTLHATSACVPGMLKTKLNKFSKLFHIQDVPCIYRRFQAVPQPGGQLLLTEM